eukprot:gnl/TRDRNA2_/TRDRNA2_163729_c2_seq2.p1 gnl/TRDRNA2_/TRDRNA2_163729_c2~~gnl/TRDRNA2_/TRDRNA2_163729_c2_seq2.p1  ORF type:complete len:378 (+),score=121.86 gnl/TRDRNA2_/TRDRNA2_163729_c2_seq2:82-1215(+)
MELDARPEQEKTCMASDMPDLENFLDAPDFGAVMGVLGEASMPIAGVDEAELSNVSLPREAVKRIARSAAPDNRLSSEAIGGLHRIAQIFVCYVTDGALKEMKTEADKGKKPKGKVVPTRKTLSVEHVLRFLTAEIPQISSKVCNLFPDLVPMEFKPPSVRLLEKLREQEKSQSTGEKGAAMQGPQAPFNGFASWAPGAQPAAEVQAKASGSKRSSDALGKATEKAAKKKTKKTAAAGDAGEEAADPAQAPAAQPPPPEKAAPSLARFFGAPKTGPAAASAPAAVTAEAEKAWWAEDAAVAADDGTAPVEYWEAAQPPQPPLRAEPPSDPFAKFGFSGARRGGGADATAASSWAPASACLAEADAAAEPAASPADAV